MKLEELRRIIYEEASRAFDDRVREALLEAKGSDILPTTSTVKIKPSLENTVEETSVGLAAILQETARSMTRTEYDNLLGTERVVMQQTIQESTAVPESGINIDSLIGRAKSILDASIIKDKERHGI